MTTGERSEKRMMTTPTTSLSKVCPDCGVVMELSYRPGPYSFLAEVDVYCDDCHARKVRAQEAELRAVRRLQRFNALKRRGLLTEEFRAASFRVSAAWVEALNPFAWSQCREWRGKENLYIHGPTGVGKSYLARCCLKRVFQRGCNVAEVSARAFCKASDTFSEGQFAAWKGSPALLLDDIDKARWTEERVGAFWELMDARASARRRTIVTGNVSPVELRAVLKASLGRGAVENATAADAALERLRPCVTIHLTGKSLRGREEGS